MFQVYGLPPNPGRRWRERRGSAWCRRYTLARNEASETVVPTTFVDDAELVWSLTEKFTQEETAKAMGWSREAVKNYKALQKIDSEAWAVIGTGFQNVVPVDEDEGVPANGTGVPKTPFSENLLRNILDLSAEQQKPARKRGR